MVTVTLSPATETLWLVTGRPETDGNRLSTDS